MVSGQERVKIVGYVDPHEWDDQGELIRVSIFSDDERYVVACEGKGKELLDLVDAEVEVTGHIRHVDSEPVLTVVHYEPVEFDDSAEDDEDDMEADWDYAENDSAGP